MKTRPNDIILNAYEEYADAIFRYCFVRIRNRELARDLMQEAFIKTWDYARKDNEIKNVRAFLYKVANNLIIDYSRKKREASLDALMDQGFDAASPDGDVVATAIDARYVIKSLEQLDEKYRDVIYMRYVDDLPIQEIADIIGESDNVVSVRLHRGIQQLKKLFPDE
jgi:RNA polymerase sigma-70 factor (ECF subfamily)